MSGHSPENHGIDVYQYSLGPHQFRLLRLDKENDVDGIGSRIRFRLVTYEVTHHPPYLALSYRWAQIQKIEDVPVLCNGLERSIAPNLDAALRAIKCSEHANHWLWIDQICINQACKNERAQQVQLMHSIFKRAEKTLIWLGSCDQWVAQRVFGMVRHISNISKATTKAPLSPEFSPLGFQKEILTPEMNRSLGLPPLYHNTTDWGRLAYLLYNDWFLRVWVVQEVALSKDDPVLMWGSESCPWTIFGDAVTWLQQKGYGVWENPRLPLRRSQTLVDLRSSNNPWELEALLQRTRRFAATDPRDMIFGLLGLTTETQTVTNWPAALRPDYGKSTRDVYRDVARFIIETSGRLTIFSAVDAASPVEDQVTESCRYPSWVPRWDLIETRAHLCISSISFKESDEGIIRIRDELNNASRGRSMQMKDTPSDVLLLEGIKVDSIKRHSRTMRFNDRLTDPHTGQLSTTIPYLWESIKEVYLDEDGVAHAFVMTTVAGRIATDEGVFRATEALVSDFWSYYLEAMQSNLSSSHGPYMEALKQKAQCGNPRKYASNIQVCNYRQLFLMSRGFIGIGPRAMRQGDLVCILFGGQVPLVLRPCTKNYKLIGEAYVHGMMQGEVFEPLEAGQLSTEWFGLF